MSDEELCATLRKIIERLKRLRDMEAKGCRK